MVISNFVRPYMINWSTLYEDDYGLDLLRIASREE